MRHIFLSLFFTGFAWMFFATPAYAQEEIPYVYFTTTPNTIVFGRPVILEWESEFVVSCVASGAWSGDLSISGSRTVYPKKKQQTYGIQCTHADGRKTIVVSRTVLGKKKAAKKSTTPSIIFQQSASMISDGDSVTFSWNARGAFACNGKGPDRWMGLKRASGQQTIIPDESASYLLVCWNKDGVLAQPKMVDVFIQEQEDQEVIIPEEEFDQPQISDKKAESSKQKEPVTQKPHLSSEFSVIVDPESRSIVQGEKAKIYVRAWNTTACYWGDSPATELVLPLDFWESVGSLTLTVQPKTTEVYVFRCENANGSTPRKSVTISVTGKPAVSQPVPAQPTQMEPKQPEKVVTTPVVVTPLPFPDCDGTSETFRKTGVITCGRIAWKLHPAHAVLLTGDSLGYLMLYDRLYGTLKDLLGYEPKEKKMEIMEQCPPSGGTSCPNGKMGWDYPMYVLGGNTVYITSDFFENYFWKLANSSEHPISASIQHEMGHIFTPSQDSKYAYLWDSSFIEKFASVWGNMGALMANELSNTKERYYWDAWCRAKGKSVNTCVDSYTTLDDWASLGSDADWKNFIANPKAVGNVYPYTLDMIIQLYRQFKNQGRLQDFYNGFRATFRYYDMEFSLPLAWKTYDIEHQSQDIVSAKASFFAFLLSYFTKTDLLSTFEMWGYPISQETKDAYARVKQDEYAATVFAKLVKDLTDPQTTYVGTGTGLTGWYYDSIDSYYDVDSSSLKFKQIDPVINFDWGLNAPDTRMNYDTFFVKWTGQIEAPLTGTYTFSTIGDDGVLLLVNGQPIINDWSVHAPKENSATITLEKGWKYNIRLEYFDEFYGAQIQLLWTPPGKKKELIPQSQLYAE